MDSSASDDGGPGRRRGGKAARQRMAVSSGDEDDDGWRGGLGLGAGRRKRRGNDDENLLGIFAEGESSDEGGRKRGGKGKRGKGKKPDDFSRPVGFVRGKALKPTDVPKKKEAGEDGKEEDDDDIDERFKFTGVGANGQEMPPKEQGPKLPARNQMSFAQMSTTYGKGFALLKKMGFQGGGLGKHEDGIANPIEVLKRKDKSGIQDEGEKVDQDLYGTEHTGGSKRSIDELLSPAAARENKEPKASEGWKKDVRAKRPKVTYKTAAEIAAAATSGEQPSIRIVDMRGPEVKVASSFSELAASMSGDAVKSLKELRHNTRLLVAKYEEKIRALAEKKKFYQDLLISVERDRGQIEAVSTLGDRETQNCRSMVSDIENLREKLGSIGLSELGSEFGKLREERPLEFKALRAFDVGVSFAIPVAKKELSAWQPLEKPEEGVKPLKPWWKLTEGEDAKAVHILLDGALLPRLRFALSDWSPKNFEPCIRLLECCRKSLPPQASEAIVSEIILPRLRGEVEAWDPRVDKEPIHVWIHPWLPLLGSSLVCLWSPIRFKISSSLERWHPSDHSALGVVKPWRQVFDAANWEPLVEKILARLERAISDAGVRPDGQDLQPIKDLLAWIDILPISGLAQVLELALFPQWHAALRNWLRSPECDFAEVLQWYQGWRALLPEVLRDHGPVQKQLAHGLEVMKHFMSNASQEEEAEEDASSASAPPSPRKDNVAGGAESKPLGGAASDEVSLSLSDYLAEVAGERGLVFRPKGRTNSLGRQVYQLGAATICMDKNMVLVASKSGAEEDWKVASFDEVLALAQRETKKAARKS